MLAMTEKRNDTIQVVITRACDIFNCSNCTQLLPWRRDAAHMSVDVAREAFRSLRDWPGIVGIFGGNPCSHPRFEAILAALREEIPERRRRGIWTNNLLGHGAAVRETFYPDGRFNLNAHRDERAAAEMDRWLPGRLIRESDERASWHSPILLDRRDLGIDDEAWVALRERCDINLNWSGAVIERGGRAYGYFCEVAAALDGIRGENHGIPVAPGWWRAGMDAFRGQVEGCCDRGCGVPLRGRGHVDTDAVYDVTGSWASALGVGRGKVRVEVHEEPPPDCAEATDYMQLRTNRVER